MSGSISMGSGMYIDPTTGRLIPIPSYLGAGYGQGAQTPGVAQTGAPMDDAPPVPRAPIPVSPNEQSASPTLPSGTDWLYNPLDSFKRWRALPATAPGRAFNQAPPSLGPAPPVYSPGDLPVSYTPPAYDSAASSPPPPQPPPGPQPPPTGGDAASVLTGPRAAQGTPPAPPAASPAQTPTQDVVAPQAPPADGLDPNDPAYQKQRAKKWIYGGESSDGKRPEKNPNSSASGNFGLTDGRFEDFVRSPANDGKFGMADKNSPKAQEAAVNWSLDDTEKQLSGALHRPLTSADYVAAHMLGVGGYLAVASHPNDPALASYTAASGPEIANAAFKNNGKILNPTMTGAQALASINSFYGGHASPSGGASAQVQGAPPPSSVPGSGGPPPPSSVPGSGGPPPGPQIPPPQQRPGFQLGASDPLAGLSPLSTMSQKMAALGAGMMGGGGRATDKFAQGLTNLGGIQAADQENVMKAAGLRAQIENQRTTQQLALGRLQNAQTSTDNRMALGTANVGVREQAQNTASQRLQTYQAIASGKLSGKTEGVEKGIADNAQEVKEINDLGETAGQRLQAMNSLQQTLDTAGPGPGALQAFKRWASQAAGIPIGGTDPTSQQLASALISSNQANAAQAMRGLGLRTQNEFNTFVKGVGTLDTDPNVLRTLLAPVIRNSQKDYDVYAKWQSPETDQNALASTPWAIQRWKAPFIEKQAADNGVQAGGPTTPTVAKTPTGWTPTQTADGYRLVP